MVTRCSPFFVLALTIVVCFSLILLSSPMLPRRAAHEEEIATAEYSRRRTELYEIMAGDLEKHGATFLNEGTTSQSLNLSNIFCFKDGHVQPVLKVATPAVRACVLYLAPDYAEAIAATVTRILAPIFPGGVWFQDPKMYHFSLFHASHHLDPVMATEVEIDAEARQVEYVARRCCEMSIVLDKVILTSTGVLLGCWQVLNGTDPAVIRRELHRALPRAPEKQLYNEVMLHTSFARILRPPQSSGKDVPANANYDPVSVFQHLVSELNEDLYQFKAAVRELWYVEELDVMALGLNGRFKSQRFTLQCLND